MVRYALLRTVVDPLLAMADDGRLVRLEFLPRAWEYHTRAHAIARDLGRLRAAVATAGDGDGDGHHATFSIPEIQEDRAAFDELTDQLAEYFVGRRHAFEVTLDLQGTEFQVRVWRALQTIPYGETRTYGEVARALEQPRATRAVGQAAGHNPLPIVVPCHRVVGQGGSLVGFAAGITTKARLLRLEGHTLGDSARIEEPRLF